MDRSGSCSKKKGTRFECPIPENTWLEIIKYLASASLDDVRSMSMVSKAFYELVDDKEIWRRVDMSECKHNNVPHHYVSRK